MRIGGNGRWGGTYICDKCKKYILYKPQEGYKNRLFHHYVSKTDHVQHKDFDLCNVCEKKLKKWLKEQEMEMPQDIIDRFPEWEDK